MVSWALRRPNVSPSWLAEYPPAAGRYHPTFSASEDLAKGVLAERPSNLMGVREGQGLSAFVSAHKAAQGLFLSVRGAKELSQTAIYCFVLGVFVPPDVLLKAVFL